MTYAEAQVLAAAAVAALIAAGSGIYVAVGEDDGVPFVQFASTDWRRRCHTPESVGATIGMLCELCGRRDSGVKK